MKRTREDTERTSTASPPQKRQKTDLLAPSETLPLIHAQNLHFDLEKFCSKTLVTLNILQCLTCGKYFAGGHDSAAVQHAISGAEEERIAENAPKRVFGARHFAARNESQPSNRRLQQDTLPSSHSHASTSSLAPHSLFLNTETAEFLILPQYQKVSASLHPLLEQIHWNLNPVWESITDFDSKLAEEREWHDLSGITYIPGARILNTNNSSVASTISLLCNITPIRNYFMTRESISPLSTRQHPLSYHFSELLRRIWNNKSFRSHLSISPLAKIIERESNGQFKVATGDGIYPLDVLNFLTNQMQKELSINKLPSPFHCMQGKLKLQTSVFSTKGGQLLKEVKKSVPFRVLTCEVPFMTLYKDEHDRQIIPQVDLQVLLEKYDGSTETSRPSTLMPGEVERSTYEIRKLPEYVVLHLQRTAVSDATLIGKNRTIVTFPTRRFDLEGILLSKKKSKSGALYNYVGSIVENVQEDVQTLDRRSKRTTLGTSYHVLLHHEPTDQFFKCDAVSCQAVGEESVCVGNTIIVVFKRNAQKGLD